MIVRYHCGIAVPSNPGGPLVPMAHPSPVSLMCGGIVTPDALKQQSTDICWFVPWAMFWQCLFLSDTITFCVDLFKEMPASLQLKTKCGLSCRPLSSRFFFQRLKIVPNYLFCCIRNSSPIDALGLTQP